MKLKNLVSCSKPCLLKIRTGTSLTANLQSRKFYLWPVWLLFLSKSLYGTAAFFWNSPLGFLFQKLLRSLYSNYAIKTQQIYSCDQTAYSSRHVMPFLISKAQKIWNFSNQILSSNVYPQSMF